MLLKIVKFVHITRVLADLFFSLPFFYFCGKSPPDIIIVVKVSGMTTHV